MHEPEKRVVEHSIAELVDYLLKEFRRARPDAWQQWRELERANRELGDLGQSIYAFIHNKVAIKEALVIQRVFMDMRREVIKIAQKSF